MLPRPILLGLEFVPADLRLGILKRALGEVAAATPRDQACLWGVRRGIEQRIREVALTIASYHQPFGAWSLARCNGPDAPHREGCYQPPTFRVAHLYLLPRCLRMLRRGAHLMGVLTTQHLQPRARPASLAPLRGRAHMRLTQIHQRVRRHLARLLDVCCRRGGSKLAVPPIP